ncbi:hypothetical protein IWX63_003286 [Arthrobacter sp. CAN_A2]|uniref:hypothetical protein n=1 Tax=Arthrobacter sp. CAN_A2 TaxID=2787718 RepID=UPI0018EF746A
MRELMQVWEVKRLLQPMFESMLTSEELRSLTFRVVRVVDGMNGRGLPDSDVIELSRVWVRWQIAGEDGGSGSLILENGIDSLASGFHEGGSARRVKS